MKIEDFEKEDFPKLSDLEVAVLACGVVGALSGMGIMAYSLVRAIADPNHSLNLFADKNLQASLFGYIFARYSESMGKNVLDEYKKRVKASGYVIGEDKSDSSKPF